LEKPALAPLPAEHFDMSQWSRSTVNIDYHIAFDGNFYSVSYALVQQVVEIRSSPSTDWTDILPATIRILKPKRLASSVYTCIRRSMQRYFASMKRRQFRLWLGSTQCCRWGERNGMALNTTATARFRYMRLWM
jgi:hypothetical protein